MPTIALKVDKSQLDSSFWGYKLSLDSLPIYSSEAKCGIKNLTEIEQKDQSYLLSRLRGFFNNLFVDLWLSTPSHTSLYYVNAENEIISNVFSGDDKFKVSGVVWNIPDSGVSQSDKDQLPVSITFPSVDTAVVSDGYNHLYILHTGDRDIQSNKQWTLSCDASLLLESKKPFVVIESKVNPKSKARMECILLSVCEAKDVEHYACDENSSAPPHVTVLDWLNFELVDSKYALKQTRQLVSSAFPNYLALDPETDSILLASGEKFEIMYDSLNPVPAKNPKKECLQLPNEKVNKRAYTWTQTPEDIAVTFELADDATVTDVVINFNTTSVSVAVKGSKLLEGNLWSFINVENSTWTLEDGKRVELMLTKGRANETWMDLIEGGDKDGEEINDPQVVEEAHERLSHLTSHQSNQNYNPAQLEECDASPWENSTFQIIDGKSHRVTHEANLLGHQFLFSVSIESNEFPLMCIRHDVDGLLWRPERSGDEWDCKHRATFNALGFVQASKQDKKFLSCCPDFSYAALASVKKHIYVYRQRCTVASNSDVRNRKTSERVLHIAKQHLISLESNDAILGMFLTNDFIFVLTKTNIFAVAVSHN